MKRKLFRYNFNKDVFLSKLIKDLRPIIKTGNVLYNEIQQKFDEKDRRSNTNLPTFAKTINSKEHDRYSTLYFVDGPLQLLHPNIVDLNFLKPSATKAKHTLVILDIFNSFIYASGLKSRKYLVLILEDFYKKILILSRNHRRVRIQTDLEFTQNNTIKELNDQYNIEMFSTKIKLWPCICHQKKKKKKKEN